MKAEKFCLGVALVLSAAAFAGSARGDGFVLYNVVSCSPGNERRIAEDAIEYRDRTGNDLVLCSMTLHPEGRPAMAKVRSRVESFRRLKAELDGTGVRAGILVQSILGHWPYADKDAEEDWMWAVDAKGRRERFCPLDPGFEQYIADTFTLLAGEHPAFIMTDDDVRGYSHEAECFCERHMALFNARRGTHFSSDELRSRLKSASPSDPDYVAFLAMQRETVEGVVRRARAAIDAVDPAIPGGICIASEEHYLCAPLARAMAAKGQRPIMRTSTSAYLERMTAAAAPRCVSRMMGFEEYYRGSGIDLLCESDTWPHNLWSKSSRSFFTHMANAAFTGMSGAKTWHVNGHKGQFAVSRSYTDVLAENRGFLPALAEAVRGSEWEGLAVPCLANHPGWHAVTNHNEFFIEKGGAGERICATFGIPFRAVRDFGLDCTYALSAEAEVYRLSDDDLRRMLSRRTVVFRDAAVALTRRGFGGLTGVEAKVRKLAFSCEHDDMNNADLQYTSASGSVMFTADPSAEVLSTLGLRPYTGSERYESVSPAAVLFSNSLGGRVLTVQYHPRMVEYQLFSEARRAWLLAALDRLSGGPVFAAGHDQDVMVLVRRKSSGERIVLLENLNPDPIRQVSFRAVHGPCVVERLCGDGSWRPVPSKTDGGNMECDVSAAFYEAVVLRIRPVPDA